MKRKSEKEKRRSAILADVARLFVYWDNEELSKIYAREIVRQLVEWKLVDATLPLRPPE